MASKKELSSGSSEKAKFEVNMRAEDINEEVMDEFLAQMSALSIDENSKFLETVDEHLKHLELVMKAMKAKKAEAKTSLSERLAPQREALRKEKQKASAELRKAIGAEERKEMITLTITTNLYTGKPFEPQTPVVVTVRVPRGYTTGKLMNEIFRQMNTAKPKKASEKFNLTHLGKEIYNMGPNKIGLTRLTTLKLQNDDRLILTRKGLPKNTVPEGYVADENAGVDESAGVDEESEESNATEDEEMS